LKKALPAAAALVVAVCALLVSGWADSLESIRKGMSEVKTVSCSFTQKKEVRILTKPLLSRGRLYYMAPDSIRWEYMSPVKSVLIVDRGSVKRFIWRDTKFIEDTTARVEAMRIVAGQIARWFAGDFKNSADFRAEIVEGRVELIPVNKTIKGFISRVVITFSRREGVISMIEIIEVKGAKSILEFSDVEINGQMPDGIFSKVE
jgi:outer membrane lipoprotein-sorting protein